MRKMHDLYNYGHTHYAVRIIYWDLSKFKCCSHSLLHGLHLFIRSSILLLFSEDPIILLFRSWIGYILWFSQILFDGCNSWKKYWIKMILALKQCVLLAFVLVSLIFSLHSFFYLFINFVFFSMKVNEIKVQSIDTAFVYYKRGDSTMKTNIFLSTNVKYSRVIIVISTHY